jgi:hypothetical protein
MKRVMNELNIKKTIVINIALFYRYIDTATAFASECSLNFDQYTMCENIDLNSIFIDFEAYYHLRFQRHPQYFRFAK